MIPSKLDSSGVDFPVEHSEPSESAVLDPVTSTRAIWTDASYWGDGHSWAWVDDRGDFAHGRSRGWAVDSTGAELWAIAEGLRATPPGGVVHVNTDCEIAAILMQPFAVVKNTTLAHPRDVRRFRESRDEVGWLCMERSVTVHWVKGHGSDVRNRAADKLATAARRGYNELSRWHQVWAGAMLAVDASNNGRPDQVACTCGLMLG